VNGIMEPVVTITLAIVGVATLAVLVSKKADTSNVLKAYGQTFSAMIGAATAPVTGAVPSSFGLNTPVLGSTLSPQFGYSM
jgi:hypothetical protein